MLLLLAVCCFPRLSVFLPWLGWFKEYKAYRSAVVLPVHSLHPARNYSASCSLLLLAILCVSWCLMCFFVCVTVYMFGY